MKSVRALLLLLHLVVVSTAVANDYVLVRRELVASGTVAKVEVLRESFMSGSPLLVTIGYRITLSNGKWVQISKSGFDPEVIKEGSAVYVYRELFATKPEKREMPYIGTLKQPRPPKGYEPEYYIVKSMFVATRCVVVQEPLDEFDESGDCVLNPFMPELR